jgi:NADH-ubiquinone oxidoreductase chain 6
MDINSVITNIINKEPLLYVSSYTWDGVIIDISDIASIGNIMYTSYSMWLILTSVILLLAMVGSIVITIKQKY